MPSIEVPGATLHYETFGSGPLLSLIPGADGRGSIFYTVAKLLTPCFTVVCWDRRGYSKSFLKGPQDFNHPLSTDADDAHLLIQHLSNDPATVFGTSSGAIKLIAHEPPALAVLPEDLRTQGTGLIRHIYDTYRTHGTEAAMNVFTSGLSEGDDGAVMRSCMDAERGDEIRANSMFWFEFELQQYTSAPVDLKILEAEKEKFVPVAGVESGDGPGVGPIAEIAQTLGKELKRTPGGHVGYMTTPEVFAEALLKLLK